MPTRRGWATITIGSVLIATGRVFGVRETIEVGVVLLLLWAVGALSLLRERPDLVVERRFSATRVFPGEQIRVRIAVHNRGATRTPAIHYEEHLTERTETATLPSLRPEGRANAGYEIRPQRRGAFVVGPGRAFVEDPFRMARRTFRRVDPAEVIVYPATEPLMRRRGSAEAVAQGLVRAPAPAAAGAEFYTIRQHQHGDDLRKVHWVSSARSRRLMIRQEEQHRHATTTIVVDDCRGSYLDDVDVLFERCLEAAASLIELFLDSSGTVEMLMKSDGSRMPAGKGPDHRHRLLERLARAEVRPGSVALVDLVSTSRPDHLVLVTPSAKEPTLITAQRKAARTTVVLLVGTDPAETRTLSRAGITVVVAEPSLAAGWNIGAQGVLVR